MVKSKSMKNLLWFLSISIILLSSCNKKNEINKSSSEIQQKKNSNSNLTNNFDEILYFTVSDEIVKKNENNQKFQDVYSTLDDKKIDITKFEKQLIDLGFTSKNIPENKINSIIETITKDLNLKHHEVACIPNYNDIFIFKKKKRLIAGLKICFECGMNESIGKINSNFNTQNPDEISNYSVLYEILYTKEYSQY